MINISAVHLQIHQIPTKVKTMQIAITMIKLKIIKNNVMHTIWHLLLVSLLFFKNTVIRS